MTDISELIERVTKPADNWCPKCNGSGWLVFKCGTPWMCTCNPNRHVPRLPSLSLQSEADK